MGYHGDNTHINISLYIWSHCLREDWGNEYWIKLNRVVVASSKHAGQKIALNQYDISLPVSITVSGWCTFSPPDGW